MAAPGLSIDRQLERLTAQLTAQRQRLTRLLQRRDEKQRELLRRLDELSESRLRQLQATKAELARLRGYVRDQEAQALRSGKLLRPHTTTRLAILERLERIASGTRPIIVGPWTGEVGYEVLYWSPFVRWFVEHYGVDPARLRIISRGGPQSWYLAPVAQYVDALSFLSPDEFRARSAALAWMKQHQVNALDRQILRDSREACGRGRPALLHPSLMFRLLRGFWGERLSLNDVMTYTRHSLLVPPPPIPGLPPRYIAARFYFRSSFPETPENRALVGRILATLTSRSAVVLLNPGFRIDDHSDYSAGGLDRLYTIDHLLSPDRNLDVQTAVIARAEAFVGSYGGFSYLAPLLGVPSLALYSAPTFKTCHLELAEHVFARVGGASITVMDTADLELITDVIPEASPGGQ